MVRGPGRRRTAGVGSIGDSFNSLFDFDRLGFGVVLQVIGFGCCDENGLFAVGQDEAARRLLGCWFGVARHGCSRFLLLVRYR